MTGAGRGVRMLHVHLTDGRTLSFDPAIQEDVDAIASMEADGAFQCAITSVTLQSQGIQHSLARPRGLNPVTFHYQIVPDAGPSKGAERATFYAGALDLTLVVHASAAARTVLRRIGTMVYAPKGQGVPDEQSHT